VSHLGDERMTLYRRSDGDGEVEDRRWAYLSGLRGSQTGCHHSGTLPLSRARPVVAFVREWPRWNLDQGRTAVHRSSWSLQAPGKTTDKARESVRHPKDASGVASVNRRLDPPAPAPVGAHSGARRAISPQRYVSATTACKEAA
jgi:hypothetical protein